MRNNIVAINLRRPTEASAYSFEVKNTEYLKMAIMVFHGCACHFF